MTLTSPSSAIPSTAPSFTASKFVNLPVMSKTIQDYSQIFTYWNADDSLDKMSIDDKVVLTFQQQPLRCIQSLVIVYLFASWLVQSVHFVPKDLKNKVMQQIPYLLILISLFDILGALESPLKDPTINLKDPALIETIKTQINNLITSPTSLFIFYSILNIFFPKPTSLIPNFLYSFPYFLMTFLSFSSLLIPEILRKISTQVKESLKDSISSDSLVLLSNGWDLLIYLYEALVAWGQFLFNSNASKSESNASTNIPIKALTFLLNENYFYQRSRQVYRSNEVLIQKLYEKYEEFLPFINKWKDILDQSPQTLWKQFMGSKKKHYKKPGSKKTTKKQTTKVSTTIPKSQKKDTKGKFNSENKQEPITNSNPTPNNE